MARNAVRMPLGLHRTYARAPPHHEATAVPRFHGVLHTDAVYRTRRETELRAEGKLCMWAPLVWAATLLSTSWARNLGFQRARKGLPAKLHQRVIGATRHSAMSGSATDYIAWDNAEVVSWLAIDNNAVGWSDTKSPVADPHRAKQWDCRYDYHG